MTGLPEKLTQGKACAIIFYLYAERNARNGAPLPISEEKRSVFVSNGP